MDYCIFVNRIEMIYRECQMKKDGEFCLFCHKSKIIPLCAMEEHRYGSIHSFP
jgi:hypothetical protein